MSELRVVQLPEHREPGFRVVGIRGAIPTGYVLNVDHFCMSEPTIPPHPHAGFAALTYVLPNSPSSMTNRDSHGDRSEMAPGGLHCTIAGSGIVHEEGPSTRGVESHGLQIFLKLPREHELDPPRIHRCAPSEVPLVEHGGAVVRVVLGDYRGVASTVPIEPRTTLLHIELSAGATFHLPAPAAEAFALVLDGDGELDDQKVRAASAVVIRPDAMKLVAGDQPLRMLFGDSPRLDAPVYWAGPFCVFERARLAEAQARYRAGAMGTLTPTVLHDAPKETRQ